MAFEGAAAASSRDADAASPFARGSVSIRLYPHNELPAPRIVDELCAQARLALRYGFDGVMTAHRILVGSRP